MTSLKPTLVILAAGMGSRFGGLKQLAPVGPNNQIIFDYSVFDALRAGFGKAIFIIKKEMEETIRELLLKRYEGSIETEIVFQELDILPDGFGVPDGREKPWGTGHALLMAEPAVSTPFCVINADDFYGYAAYRDMAAFLTQKASPEDYSMVGYRLDKTLSLHGTVSRGVCDIDADGLLKTVIERTKIDRQDGEIVAYEGDAKLVLPAETLVSMNFWGFTSSVFDYLRTGFEEFLQERGQEMKSEYLLPVVIDALVQQGKVSVSVLDSQSEWFGITYKEDLEATRTLISQMTQSGEYPEKLWP
jgi:NDP-sugar pyrophosphorylase family protein